MTATTTFSHGNREVTMSISGAEKWEKADMSRTYFTLGFAGAKLAPIDKLYEVLAGGTKDDTIQVHGRTFGYQLGISCDSKTKRAAAIQAITDLLTAHFAPAPEPELEASEVEADDDLYVKDFIKSGDIISADTLKALAARAGATKIQVMDDGSWPYDAPLSDIEDHDTFKVIVNYWHEVQFHLQGHKTELLVIVPGVVGHCDNIHHWVIKKQ